MKNRIIAPSYYSKNYGILGGGSRIFFRRGCTRLSLYFNNIKPHSFFFRRIPVVLENRRSSRGGGGAHSLHPPPRSAPAPRTFHELNPTKFGSSREKFDVCPRPCSHLYFSMIKTYIYFQISQQRLDYECGVSLAQTKDCTKTFLGAYLCLNYSRS